jgi:hypothetical protein
MSLPLFFGASRRAVLLATLCLAPISLHATSPNPEDTAQVITQLLGEFLSRVDDPEMHQRFWADDLIYTSGQGIVRTKPQIVASVAEAASDSAASTARMTYEAEEIRVRPYGEFAALNFRLVVINPDGTRWYSRNSGAFLWREGRWEVVTWQATRESN